MFERLSGSISANFLTEIEQETNRFIEQVEAEQREKEAKKRGGMKWEKLRTI